MTDIAFYHLTRSSLEQTLPKLLEKTLGAEKRAVVMTGSPERAEALAGHLWTYDANAWLPHGAAKDGNAEDQPVWLTDADENLNDASFLFLTDGAQSEHLGDYERCFELFDGQDDGAVTVARERWKVYGAAGHNLTYWQQSDDGRWQEKG